MGWDSKAAIRWLVQHHIVSAQFAIDELLQEEFTTPEALLAFVERVADWSGGKRELFRSVWAAAGRAQQAPSSGRTTRAGKRRIRSGNTQPSPSGERDPTTENEIATRATLPVLESRDTLWDGALTPSGGWDTSDIKYQEQGTIGSGGMGTVRPRWIRD